MVRPVTIWASISDEIARFPVEVRELPVAPVTDPVQLRAALETQYRFDSPRALDEVTAEVMRLFRAHTVHVTHPRYFGLFNPSVREAGIIADTLSALYNPQLAAWSHAPAACELERLTLRRLAGLLGFDPDTIIATFTTGGAEANLSAVLAALAHHCPEADRGGVAALAARPAIYVSGESHHSFVKIARMTGLGTDALRIVPTTSTHTLDPVALAECVRADTVNGWRPLLIVGTAGTTSAGVIDPLPQIADVAEAAGAWFHVDAAWGGGAALSAHLRPLLAGVERADSVTWDAHKWLSVPMGAGMFFCRHPDAVRRAFAAVTSYMPDAVSGATDDPYVTSAQWSRRAIGLKVFMALAELGVDGYATLIEHQVAMGDLLRTRLTEAGWLVVNDTALPVICFTHPSIRAGMLTTRTVLEVIYTRGFVWISDVVLGGQERVLRACITSYRTTSDDVDTLVTELERSLAGGATS